MWTHSRFIPVAVGLWFLLAGASTLWAEDNPIDFDIATLRYRVVILPGFGNGETESTAINSHGTIVGRARDQNRAWTGVLWKNEQITQLGGFMAMAVNDSGCAAGNAIADFDVFGKELLAPVMWDEAGKATHDLLPPLRLAMGSDVTLTGVARAMNQAGDVGMSGDTKFGYTGVLRTAGGQIFELGSLGGNYTVVHGMNDHRTVVGYSRKKDRIVRAFFWKNGSMSELETLGGPHSGAHAINNRGHIVGISSTDTNIFHACLWKNGNIRDLGALGAGASNALALNDATAVVGESDTDAGRRQGCIWHGGKIRNLNAMIPQNSGIEIRDARGINCHWQIAANAIRDGKTIAVRLDPVTEDNQETQETVTDRTVSPAASESDSTQGDPPTNASPDRALESNPKPAFEQVRKSMEGVGSISLTPLDRSPDGWTIETNRLVASADMSRFAYVCKRDNQVRVVVDGAVGEPVTLAEDLSFSPDGKRFFHTISAQGVSKHFLDDKPLPIQGKLDARSFEFSPDSNHFVYRITQKSKAVLGLELPVAIVLDGKPQTQFRFICQGRFSPDSQRFGMLAVKDGIPSLVVNDKVLATFADIPDLLSAAPPIFSPDSRRVACVGLDRHKNAVLSVDGKVLVTAPTISCVQFSPDSQHIACIVGDGGNHKVLVDGKTQSGGTYQHIYASLTYSQDGKRLAFSAAGKGFGTVVVDGKEQSRFDAVGSEPVFSPDGRHVAAWVKRGASYHLAVNGEPGPAWDDWGPSPIFSADSTQIAYVGKRRGKSIVRVAGNDGPEVDRVLGGSLVFTPDGRHHAYWAQRQSMWKLIVDGKETTEEFSAVFTNEPLHFRFDEFVTKSIDVTAGNQIRTIALRDQREAVRIELTFDP